MNFIHTMLFTTENLSLLIYQQEAASKWPYSLHGNFHHFRSNTFYEKVQCLGKLKSAGFSETLKTVFHETMSDRIISSSISSVCLSIFIRFYSSLIDKILAVIISDVTVLHSWYFSVFSTIIIYSVYSTTCIKHHWENTTPLDHWSLVKSFRGTRQGKGIMRSATCAGDKLWVKYMHWYHIVYLVCVERWKEIVKRTRPSMRINIRFVIWEITSSWTKKNMVIDTFKIQTLIMVITAHISHVFWGRTSGQTSWKKQI